MAFLGGIGSAFKSAFNAVKSFAGSSIGQFALKAVGNLVAPGIGGIIAGAAGKLLSGKKVGFGDLIRGGLNAFAPVAGKLAGSLISKLPTALQAPLGNIASSLLKGEKPSLSSIAGILSKTKLGGTLSKVLNQAQKFLGLGTKVGGDAQGVFKSISNLLGNFGVNTGGLNKASDTISKVLGTLNSVQGFINKAMGIFNPQIEPRALRA